MKKKLKKTLIIIGSTFFSILLILVIASVLLVHQKPLIKRILEKQISKRTGIHIKIGILDYEIFPLKIAAGNISFTTSWDYTEVDVFVQKLNLVGDIHRIRNKVKPYFDTVEAEGIRVDAQVKKASDRMAIDDILNGLSSFLDFGRQIDLKNADLAFAFLEQRIILQGMDFSVSPSEGSDTLAYPG